MSAPPAFEASFEVRDYECDLQGIVNNAIYQQYLEHARHLYLKRRGLSFAELTKAGIYLVVVRAEIDYKAPLRSGDVFVVSARLQRLTPVRFAFQQELHRTSPGARQLVLTARIICAAMNQAGKPIIPKGLDALFESSYDASASTRLK